MTLRVSISIRLRTGGGYNGFGYEFLKINRLDNRSLNHKIFSTVFGVGFWFLKTVLLVTS